MRNLAAGLLLGVVSSTNLRSDNLGDIWDESMGMQDQDVCSDPKARWAHSSNSWDTYKKAYQGTDAWVDTEFTADMNSIYSAAYPPQNNRGAQYDKQVVGWKRPKDIYPGEKVHYKGKLGEFAPAGIKQGSIADCWFLATVTAIAEHPPRLHKNFHKNNRFGYSPNGIFRYFFWINGEWVPINIDDQLPVQYMYTNSKDYFKPFSADRSNFGAWWMPLFEKAYAKFVGNYDRLEWGWSYESLRQLTEKPVFFYEHKKIKKHEGDEYALFQRLARENHPMVISCCQVPKG